MANDPSRGGVELMWPGKYTDTGELAEPPQLGAKICMRTYHGDRNTPNRVILGDNLAAMQALCTSHSGQVDLIYIDPPFATGGKFSVATKVGDEAREGGVAEVRTTAYNDAWPGGFAGFLQMLAPRLRLLHRLLSPSGSMYIHVDPTIGHAVKLLADEIFGPGCFQREIVWRIGWLSGFKTKAKNWIRNHDLIFFYTKDPRNFTFNKHYVPHAEGYRRRDGKKPTSPGTPIEDVWNANASEFELRGAASLDSIQIKSFSTEKTGWATQKNQSLLRRIIEASSNPGDLVLDAFCGSGTTAVVAAQTGRRFIACDTSATAVHITRKRLLSDGTCHAFAVCELDGRERELLAQPGWRARVVTHFGGELVDDGLLDGVRERRGIVVAPVRGDFKPGQWQQVLGECTRRALVGLDVLTFGPKWPTQHESLAAADTCHYRLTRDLFDPRVFARPPTGIVPRARIHASFAGPPDGLHIELQGLGFAAHAGLPEPLRVAVGDSPTPSLDAVDAWGVDIEHPEQPGVWVPQNFVFRGVKDRRLAVRQPVPRRASLRLRVLDVLGQLRVVELACPVPARV